MDDTFKSDLILQIEANAKLAATDLSQYMRVETQIANATDHDCQRILANLKIGDRLKFIQSRSHAKPIIEMFTPSGKLIGNIPHPLVHDLTFKSDLDPDGDIDYANEKYYYFLTGFAVVKAITGSGSGKYKCDIDLYYIRH
jgi:hypothetical protein